MIHTHTVSGYEVVVYEPTLKASPIGILLNDGGNVEALASVCGDAWLFGVLPQNRLSDYTPWPAPAMRGGAPDFGGACKNYTDRLTGRILPVLSERYGIQKWVYGGHSLGGLAAVYSLYHADIFQAIFSVCGSFWYPGFIDYLREAEPVNMSAQVYLLNGATEGMNHNNRLADAPLFATEAHNLISSTFPHTQAGFDPYGHHEHITARLSDAVSWCISRV